jgi:spermidine synthase
MAVDVSALLWLCFTISGGAALALEVLWMRSASLVLGQTAATTAIVLACYFGGLGLGAAAARNVRQRGVHTYGWLEIGAAGGALWSVCVWQILTGDGAQLSLAASGVVGRVAAVALAVVPATLCFGATLPALAQALAVPAAVGRYGGFLYALNTLGGVAGISAAGFGLPVLVGVRGSYYAAATTSAVTGVVALMLDRRRTSPEPFLGDSRFSPKQPLDAAPGKTGPTTQEPCAKSSPPYQGGVRGGLQSRLDQPPPGPLPGKEGVHWPNAPVSRHRLRMIAAGAGALGLGLEVLWTRLFAQVLHNSVYSFSAIALVFLVAIAAGAASAALLLRRAAPAAIAGTALIGAAVATVTGFWLFMWRTDNLAYVGMQSGLGEYIARIVALAAVSVGPAAFFSGLILPALWAAWGGHDGAARPLGDLSAANTFGGIAGAALVGFVGVPAMGVRGSLLAAAVAYIVCADTLAPQLRQRRLLAYAALFFVVIANPLRAPLVHLHSDADRLRATAVGPSGIVTVVETDGDLQMRLDNYYVLGGTAAATNERRLGLVPLLLHRAPHRALFVGLATGITASAAPALGVEQTTVVEVVPEVAQAARAHFATWNGHLLDRADVHLVLDDGRRYLASTQEQFDVIVSDLFIPWHAGAGNLYSREMYMAVARRLAPRGLFCQWLPLYQLTREEFDVIARTFLAVFPQASLWRADFYPDRAVVGLIGQRSPHSVDVEQTSRRLDRLPVWGRDPLLAAPRGLVMLYAGNLAAAADLFSGVPLNTDDRPLIEFTAPRLTRINAAGDKDWFTGEALAAFYDALAARDAGRRDPLLPPSDALADARRAGAALYRYALAASQHDDDTAAQREAEVRALVPEVIVAAESGNSGASLLDAQRALAGLQAEQEEVRHRVEAMEQRLGMLTSTARGSQ